MKKEELRTAIQEMNTYQFGQKKELTNKLSKVTSYVAKQEVLEMVSKLDKEVEGVKPELPAIPRFVADWIELAKDVGLTLVGVMDFDTITVYKTYPKVEFQKLKDYMAYGGAQKIVARAWLDGYTIEKEPEKLYRVKFAKVTKHGNEMYLDKDGGEDVISIDWSPKDFVENEDPDVYLFTEKEIKAIDERYWAFAEEVPNE